MGHTENICQVAIYQYPMKLEEQIQKLAELGLPLNEEVTIDDFLLSWTRAEYEEAPFNLILFSFGTEIEQEPCGRFFCDRVWDFDVECIEDSGDYVSIVKQFHRITGKKKQLTELSDKIDVEASHASLKYTIDGIKKELDIIVDDDWADPAAVQSIMDDFRGEEFDFFGIDNGQATVWFYMTPENALILNSLANNVFDLNKKPWWKIW